MAESEGDSGSKIFGKGYRVKIKKIYKNKWMENVKDER